MISHKAVILKIWDYKKKMAQDLPTPYVKGILQGLTVCEALVKEAEEDAKRMRPPPAEEMTIEKGHRLLQVCRVALNQLGRGNRGQAIDYLKKAVARFEPKRQGVFS